MNLKCIVGFHNWTRHCELCARCNKTRRNKHHWHHGKCAKCGRDRYSDDVKNQFHTSVRTGNFEKFSALLRDNRDLVYSDDGFPSRETALHYASEQGYKAMIDHLLANNADVNAKSSSGVTPMHLAAVKGHAGIVESLAEKGGDVNSRNNDNWTPLHYAAVWGHTDVAQVLLANKAEIDAKDNEGMTPLQRAAANGRKDLAELLVARGAAVNIHYVAAIGDLETLKAMLKEAPNLAKEVDGKGNSPLHWSAANGHTELVKLLLTNMAEINSQNRDGDIPLHLAVRNGHRDAVELLLANKADIAAHGKYGETPLHLAYRHTEVTRLLLANNANVNSTAHDGNTALHLATRWDHHDVAELLLAHGADVNATNKQGDTPVESALDKIIDTVIESKQSVPLKCEGCGTIYTAGADAICITASEMSALIGVVALKMGVNIMLDHGKSGQLARVLRERETILRCARKGWTCKKCHKDNRWQPPLTNSAISLIRQHDFTVTHRRQLNLEQWKSSGEPEAWVRNHISGWDHAKWLALLSSLRTSRFWPLEEVSIGQHIESLRARMLKDRMEHSKSCAHEWDKKGLKCSKCGEGRNLIGLTVVASGHSLTPPLNAASERDRSFFCVSKACLGTKEYEGLYDGFWLIDGTKGTTALFVIEKVLSETPSWVVDKYPRIAPLIKRN